MNEIVRAIAQAEPGVVNWQVNSALHLLDAIRPLCDATDEFLLDRPGYRVTITIERESGLDKAPDEPGLLAGQTEG